MSGIEPLVSIEWELIFLDDLLERTLVSNPPSDNEDNEYMALLEANLKGVILESQFE